MKKLLLTALVLLTSACQTGIPDPTPTLARTRTPGTSNTASYRPTATRTSTATPSPTDTPLPRRYFTEEFENVPVYWSTLYASTDTTRIDIFNRKDALTFEIYSPVAWLYAIYGAFEYQEVHLETRVESRGSDLNAMGLVCQYDEQEGWFEFNISSEGTYNVLYGQWLAEGIARYKPILSDSSERIKAGDAVNELGLDCTADFIQLYINGKLIRKTDISRYGLTGGKIGLSIASFEELPIILAFDRVQVGPLESPSD